MNYKKYKRINKIDKCNICGKTTALTWDHVPPKNCFNDKKTKYNGLFGDLHFEGEKQSKKYMIAQSGVKFRTLCSICNNSLLGAKYDPELKKLVDNLDLIINSEIQLPEISWLSMNANKISRSIIGNLLAAKKDYDKHTKIDIKLRKFFLNDTKLPPKNMKLLYHIYPHKSLMLVRDAVVMNNKKNEYRLPGGLISCISFYPVAFVLCDETETCGLDNLFSFCSSNINDKVKMRINFSSYKHSNNLIRHFLWPCRISDDEDGTLLIMGGKYMFHSVLALERQIKKNTL